MTVLDKETALECVEIIEFFDLQAKDTERQVNRIILYAAAGLPIPDYLLSALDQMESAWKGNQLKKRHSKPKVFKMVYEVRLQSLKNKKQGIRNPLTEAYKTVGLEMKETNIRSYYEASGKNYKKWKDLSNRAKQSAEEWFNRFG